MADGFDPQARLLERHHVIRYVSSDAQRFYRLKVALKQRPCFPGAQQANLSVGGGGYQAGMLTLT